MEQSDIVISGISGRFPESSNIQEFEENLLKNVNMVTVNERRFTPGLYGIPEGFGTLKEIDKFDSQFFGISPVEGRRMDPQLRMALEVTYEAMVDAGVSPYKEGGNRTGVFYAVCTSEAGRMWDNQPNLVEGPTLTGTSHSMFANRISYTWDFKGPSCSYDTACSSSIVALDAAVTAMKKGECDSALVVGSTLILTPHTTLQFQKLGMLAKDSKCKVFDSSGDGYVRAETVAAIYIQRAKDAKRVYASVVAVKTNTDGYKERGVTYPSALIQEELLREVYEEAGVVPSKISYVECHGTGTPAGDPQEVLSLSRVFVEERAKNSPLLIGSVKSNMGHSEGASGLCAIAKIITMLRHGIIPSNLHLEKPNHELNFIRNGFIKVVDKNVKWDGGLVALNSFGFGGVNTHAIFKPLSVEQNLTKEEENNFPELIIASGSTMEGVENMLKAAMKNHHLARLVNEAHKFPHPNHTHLGFAIPHSDSLTVDQITPKAVAHLWLVFNGMGSQWLGMGKGLMVIPSVEKAIKKCHDILHKIDPKFDLLSLITNGTSKNDPTEIFVAITAIQIALVDTLDCLGVKADGFIGHSAGEIGCAYADNCLTLEEAILCSYWRGKSLDLVKNNAGEELGMGVINLGWKKVSAMLPEGLYLACNNGKVSVTVSGAKRLLIPFLEEQKSSGKTATVVNSCGIAFHSPHMEHAAPYLLEKLKAVIKSPKARSDGWVTTCRGSGKADATYFVHNLTSPVSFYEALELVPKGSTLLEVGPSGLLKGLIKKSVEDSYVISLQKRNSEDSFGDFLNAIGHLYIAKGAQSGVDPAKLKNKSLTFPVPISTPSLSSLVAWDHNLNWDVPKYGKNGEFSEGNFLVDMTKKEESYLTGHQVQGRILFPATGYLVLVWKFFAQLHQIKDFQKLPVIFQNVFFDRATVLTKKANVMFRISISDISGRFEIKEGGAVICTGSIKLHDEINEFQVQEEEVNRKEVEWRKLLSTTPPHLILKKNHIYKKFRLLGYEYWADFRGIHSSDLDGNNLLLNWNNNWVPFLDTLIHSTIMANQIHTELPVEIRKLIINPQDFLNHFENLSKENINEIYAFNNWYTGNQRCCGVEVIGLKTTPVGSSWHKDPSPCLSTYSFLPYFDNVPNPLSTLSPTLQCVSIVVDNLRSDSNLEGLMPTPRIIDMTKRDAESTEALEVSRLLRVHYGILDIDYTVLALTCSEDYNKLLIKSTVVCNELSKVEELQDKVNAFGGQLDLMIMDDCNAVPFTQEFVKDAGFIIIRLNEEDLMDEELFSMYMGDNLKIVAKKVSKDATVYLLRKVPKIDHENTEIIKISGFNLSWIENLRELLVEQEDLLLNKKKAPLIYLITSPEIDPYSGLLGLILGLRKEPYCRNLRALICQQEGINLDSLREKMLQNDLAISVINRDGIWGHYVHATLSSSSYVREISLKETKDQAFLQIGVPGDLTTLTWHQGFNQGNLKAPGFTTVQIHYAALNFRDIMIATGSMQAEMRNSLPNILESPLGFEFSGVVGNRRVFGYSEGQGIATQVLADSQTVWDIPDKWSFEDAATVPVVYSTVYLAFILRSGLSEGESILIHAGAGGVGQAAIRIALSMNCKVFTTVGSKEKVAFIRKEFPQIPLEHISSSRDVDFEPLIQNLTKGKGVNVVLNSLIGEKLLASVRCIARHGRFLEIGKADLVSNKQLGLELFLRDASFHGIMLDSLWDLKKEKTKLRDLLQNGMDSGVVVPLPRRVFNLNQVEPAFRYFGQGSHIGKILIQVRGGNDTNLDKIIAHPRIYFCPEKSYIIAGGLGGFGLEMCDWMTKRYAKKLLITSRSGVTDAYQEQYIRKWEGNGVVVKVFRADASIYSQAAFVIKEALKLGPIGGFFNLTLQLEFGLMKEQTETTFEKVLSSKLTMSHNMNTLTQGISSLNHFVLFSSVASGFGFDGQSNYGFANSAMEHLCESRQRQGLPATAIQWGGIGEVGAWHEGYNQDFQITSFRGSGVQSIRSALRVLDILLTNPQPVFLSRKEIEVNMSGSLTQELSIIEKIAHILGHRNVDKLNSKSKLIELGMDSVMAIEVKTVLENDYGVVLTAAEVRTCTIEQVIELSKNGWKNKLVNGQVPSVRAATADLFQLNLMKNYSTARLIHKQTVYPINEGKDPSQGVILFCNSIEGPEILRILGPLLTRPTYSLQFTKDMPTHCIKEMTDYYIKEAKAIVPNGPYILVGYSAGIFPAIEMALKLNPKGENEKLVLMDMTPGRFDAILDENSSDRENIDEIDFALAIFAQVGSYDRQKLEHMMKKTTNREEKIQKFKEMALKIFDAGNEMDVDMLMVFSRDMIALLNGYKPSGVYKGHATLLRTTQNLISYDSTQYWGMEDWCLNPPQVRIINTTHSYMVAEPAVRDLAAILNNQ